VSGANRERWRGGQLDAIVSIDSRMGLRSRVSDADLLAAARHVLLREGVEATTASIAAHAGVSEALVFKRFGSRQALVQQALTPVRPKWADLLVSGGDVRSRLEQVGNAMIEEMRSEMPVAMLVWSRNPTDHWAQHAGEPPPVTGMKILAAWFEQEMRAGRLRRGDPELLARVFSGAIVAYSMSEMTGLAAHMPLASTTFVRGLVDFLWTGVAPNP
jgi:AcrR family transcriptional regulator